MTRRRPAPSADRIASSRVRTVARASRRLATLAQQISSTKPTTAEKEHRRQAKLAADERLVQRLEHDTAAGVGLGKLARQAFGDAIQIRACRLDA